MDKIKLLRWVDKRVFVIAVAVLLLFKGLFGTKSDNKKVLFIRLWGLGDAICTLPALKRLTEEGYSVDVLTTPELVPVFTVQSFENISLLDYTKPFLVFRLISSLRKEKYEIILDSEQFMNVSTILGLLIGAKTYIGYDHKLRSRLYNKRVEYIENQHFVYTFFDLTKPLNFNNAQYPYDLVPLFYPNTAKIKVDDILNKLPVGKLVGIHMGSGGTALGRRWDTKNFLDIALGITEYNPEVTLVFTGIKAEQTLLNDIVSDLPKGRYINTIGNLSKEEFTYLLTKMDMFICNDTGPMHMSAAMGTLTVGLFGMNHPNKVGPFPVTKHIVMYKNPFGTPIINNKYSRYPLDEDSTISLITPSEVLDKVLPLLRK